MTAATESDKPLWATGGMLESLAELFEEQGVIASIGVAQQAALRQAPAPADLAQSELPSACAHSPAATAVAAAADSALHSVIEAAEVTHGTAEQPTGLSEQPFGDAEQLVRVAEQPFGTAEQPFGVAEQLVRVAEQPFGTAKQPFAVAEQPVGTAEQPIGVSEQLWGTTDQAAFSLTDAPGSAQAALMDHSSSFATLLPEDMALTPEMEMGQFLEDSDFFQAVAGSASLLPVADLAMTAQQPELVISHSMDDSTIFKAMAGSEFPLPVADRDSTAQLPNLDISGDSDLYKPMAASAFSLPMAHRESKAQLPEPETLLSMGNTDAQDPESVANIAWTDICLDSPSWEDGSRSALSQAASHDICPDTASGQIQADVQMAIHSPTAKAASRSAISGAIAPSPAPGAAADASHVAAAVPTMDNCAAKAGLDVYGAVPGIDSLWPASNALVPCPDSPAPEADQDTHDVLSGLTGQSPDNASGICISIVL